MKPQWIVIPLLLVATASWAADTTASADSKTTEVTVTKSAPQKQPSTMQKAGDSVKNTYHKTVTTLKKHGKRAPCTKEAKSMGQCHTT
ncbi:MAG TPA: hypothetical protein VIE17_07555 [Methylophilaceae bacterium]